MANIVITNKCNLKCPYCFASDLTTDTAQYITVENFIKALNFIKTNPNERLGIVGGEPTIHPKLDQFIDIINKDNDIKNCIMFTNGLDLDKYIYKMNNKLSLLINCNTPENLGKLYSKLENNIKELHRSQYKNFALGINLYKPDMDFSYIFELLRYSENKHVRFSTAISVTDKVNSNNIIEELKNYNDIIIKFSEECIKREIVPIIDCGSIPPLCIRDEKFKKIHIQIYAMAQKNFNHKEILGLANCDTKVDILPDLKAIRSICFPYYEGVCIDNFENIDAIKQYFYDEVDSYKSKMYASEDCKECIYREKGLCNICMCFFMNKFKELKKADKEASISNPRI